MQTPLIINRDTGGNASIGKTAIKALFDYEPSQEDIDEASRSFGYDPRGYILSKAECVEVNDPESDEHGLWWVRWTAILD